MKPIRITEEDKQKIKEEFAAMLDKLRMNDGKISISKNFGEREAKGEERPMIVYTPEAYIKMDFLVRKFDTEIGWHGLIKRIQPHVFLVYDAIVYPQEVTGVTVNTDQEGYTQFLFDLPEEKANFMHYHGHSHVNMGVTPSQTDMTHRDGMLQSARDDGFWVFQIWNKRGDISSVIYDLAENTLYDTKDIDLAIILQDGTYANAFIADALSKVKKPAWTGSSYNTQPYVYPKLNEKKEKKEPKKAGKYHDADDYPLVDDTKPYGTGTYYQDYDDYGGWYN